MATLIAVYKSDGYVGHCDAKCYQAHEPDCDCICLGKNHGAGLQQARRNTEQLAERWIEECGRQKGIEGLTFERLVVQMELAFP
jgi:hypothetical protein